MKVRPYVQTRRAEAAEATRQRILKAAIEVFLETGNPGTLEAVARRAGVTVQTVLRKFGSSDGLHDAAVEAGRGEVTDTRGAAVPGDVAGAVANLLDHYDAWGDISLRLLALEPRSAAAASAVSEGRAFHRAWCERVFEPWLSRLDAAEREARTLELVAVLDVYTWKLLHRDLGQGRDAVARLLVDLVHRILA